MASNKLVLNISKTKSIVFGANHSLSSRPQLNLVMNDVAVEQVEGTKLLGVTLDCKLSWSKLIDSVVVKLGRGLSVIKTCSAFLTQHSKNRVLQGLVWYYLDYYPAMCKQRPSELQLAQNRAAHLALNCNQRANINTIHASPIG